MRIASLLPSATEIVAELGLAGDLVAISHECDWPPEVRDRRVVARRVDAALEIDDAALAEARPELVLAGGQRREVEAALARIGSDAAIVALEPTSIEGILNSIATVGAMADAEDAAVEVIEALRIRLSEIEERVQERREDGRVGTRVVALEWYDPPFAVGGWIPEQIRRAGGWDLLGRDGDRAIETSWEAIREVDPEALLLMPCGYHLPQAVREWEGAPRPAFWRSLAAVRRGQVFAVDADSYFSRPGPRVIDGIALLAEILDPDEFVETSPPGSWTPIL